MPNINDNDYNNDDDNNDITINSGAPDHTNPQRILIYQVGVVLYDWRTIDIRITWCLFKT